MRSEPTIRSNNPQIFRFSPIRWKSQRAALRKLASLSLMRRVAFRTNRLGLCSELLNWIETPRHTPSKPHTIMVISSLSSLFIRCLLIVHSEQTANCPSVKLTEHFPVILHQFRFCVYHHKPIRPVSSFHSEPPLGEPPAMRVRFPHQLNSLSLKPNFFKVAFTFAKSVFVDSPDSRSVIEMTQTPNSGCRTNPF